MNGNTGSVLTDRVIPTVSGGRQTPPHAGSLRRRCASYLDIVVPHERRQAAASRAISAGASVKVVRQMLGHESAGMTLDRYGHLYGDGGNLADSARTDRRFDAARRTTKAV